MRLAEKVVQGKAVPVASSAIGKKEPVTSRAQDLLSHDWHTPDHLSASPVQRNYTRKQERVVLALIIGLVVISLIALYILWVKATGTLHTSGLSGLIRYVRSQVTGLPLGKD